MSSPLDEKQALSPKPENDSGDLVAALQRDVSFDDADSSALRDLSLALAV